MELFGDDEGEYTEQFRKKLLIAKRQIKNGQTTPHSEVKKMLGL